MSEMQTFGGGDVPAGEVEGSQDSELERTLGLPQALAIGTGTMVGAGIFVFPGLAAGEAGPAAILSFMIGAMIALLVALPTSELATAMPESGGGYYFVSRGMGPVLGAMVGIGQWLGLVFAAAFYLMGFGYYLVDIVQAAGISVHVPVKGMAFATAVGLTAISISGTENTGRLQNIIVGGLLLLLIGFLGHGGLDALGFFGRSRVPEEFAPYGYLPVLTTAALVFTSYLGFAQIATVAGEIKNPARNLPLSMVGSVGLVGLLYAATMFISTSLIESGQLAELGETAIVGVAREIAGVVGGVLILIGGVLATLSSANASILSSSRSIYALSRDDVFPAAVSRISRRYRTPHFALLMAGGPIAVLVLFGRVEVLAEVASMLHLFMYGLMCLALILLRRKNPGWYAPDFRCPAYPLLPILGAVASFGLIAFMESLSILLGGFILAGAAGWYVIYTGESSLNEINASS
jgi:amino acid transporter